MSAWTRLVKRTPHVALMSAILSPLLPASASALPCDEAVRATAPPQVHRVYAGSGTIQAAIVQARDGDEIVLGPGIYRERIDLSGKALTIRGEAGALQTVIDGTPLYPDGPCGSTVMMRSGEGPGTRLEGLSVVGGDGTGTDRDGTQGGGLLLIGSSPILRECLVFNNSADHGGAIYSEGGTPMFIECWFYLNESRYGGASIDCVRSQPRIIACGFHEDGIQWEDTDAISVGVNCGSGGACCLQDACILTTQLACQDAGGTWKGEYRQCIEQVCPQACPGDVNGDHRVNMTDMLLLLDAWGMCPGQL